VLRKPLLPLLATSFLAVACGGSEIVVRSEEPEGPRFVVQVVDATTSAGAGLSLTSDAEGNPHMTYLAFERPPAPDEPPPPPDPTAPVLPGVLHAHLVEDLWTRSAVADQRKVAPEDGTAIAVDGVGIHHVVWTERGQLLYASNAEGEFSKAVVVSPGPASAPSIAVSEDGTVFAAFVETPGIAEGPTALVRVATDGPGQGAGESGRWTVETAAEAEPAPSTTAIGATAGGSIVAFGHGSGTVVARRADGDLWRSEVADPQGGVGVDMALDADGNPHVSYLTAGGAVRHAHSIAGSPWEVSDVATGPGVGRTAIALSEDGVHHVAWEASDLGVSYANNQEGDFASETLRGTEGGTLPALAAGPDDVVHLAWHDPEGAELQLATRTEDEPLLAVPSPEEPAPGPAVGDAECQPDGAELALTAPPGAVTSGFDTECLAVEAAASFTVDMANENGTPHNFSIYTDPGAAEALLDGSADIVQPGSTFTYEGEPIPDPGNFFFRCDLHPTTMTGTFVVAEAGGGGGGEAGGAGGGGTG